MIDSLLPGGLTGPPMRYVVTNHVQIFSIVVLSQTAPARIKSDASSTNGLRDWDAS